MTDLHFLEASPAPPETVQEKAFLEKRGDSIFLFLLRGDRQIPPGNEPSLVAVLERAGLREEVDMSTGRVQTGAFGAIWCALKKAGFPPLELVPAFRRFLREVPPDDFSFSFRWAASRKRMIRSIEPPAEYLGRGWFLTPKHLWQMPGITDEDDLWLGRAELDGPQTLSLLQTGIVRWRQLGLPFTVDLVYEEHPPFRVDILRVERDRVALRLCWLAREDVVEDFPGLPGFVMVGRTVSPGYTPGELPPGLRDGGCGELLQEEIPRFLRHLPDPRIWAKGDVDALLNFHRPILGPGQPTLEILREDRPWIGEVVAKPMMVFPEGKVEAASLLPLISRDVDYLSTPFGWVSWEALPPSWQEGSPPSDGTFMQPMVLNPEEILRQGSLRLAGAWRKVSFPTLNPVVQGSPLEVAAKHLEFLRAWGLPGGLVGTIQGLHPVLRHFLQSALNGHLDSRILVVGSRTALHLLTGTAEEELSAFSPGQNNRLVLVSPPELEEHSSLLQHPWSLLFLLEADLLVHSPSSALYRTLLRCPRQLTLGTFRREEFLRRALPRTALSRLFGVGSYSNLWKYTLRQPDLPPVNLPLPYAFPSPAAQEGPFFATISLPDIPFDRGVPIPPRREPLAPSEVLLRSPVTEEVWQRHSSHFLEDALDLAAVHEEEATFTPFSKGFPTYSDMDRGQLKWFLYWRDQARLGIYLPGDTGYFLLHAYELINQVGVEEPMEGFQSLRQLWLAYRIAFPSLDELLVDWLADYLLVYGCPMDPLLVYREAFPLLGRLRDPNLAFSLFLEESWERWPLLAIELALDYRLRWTDFWASGRGELLEKWIPRALAESERMLQTEDSRGILVRFRPREPRRITRYPFHGARYRGELRLLDVATIWPYTEYAPMRHFLTAVVQATENRLRQVTGFPLLPNIVSLPPSLEERIEKLLPARLVTHEVPPVPMPDSPIHLDRSRIEYLEAEIGELQSLLAPLAGEAPEEELPVLVNTPVQAGEAAVDFPGFPSEWSLFARQLLPFQIRTLWAILDQEDPSMQLSAIAQEQAMLPEMVLDKINELALDTIGDFLLEPGADPPRVEDEQRETLRAVLAMIGNDVR
jgi:hypothetical protein